jgi:hypothetical protein
MELSRSDIIAAYELDPSNSKIQGMMSQFNHGPPIIGPLPARGKIKTQRQPVCESEHREMATSGICLEKLKLLPPREGGPARTQ